jgi:DNA repair exonuclease SbcCD ATPase subunit
MKLVSLRLKNFMSYGDSSIKFPEGIVGVVGRYSNSDGDKSNGAGKSAIFEGILYCLYGYKRCSESETSLIRIGQKEMLVELIVDVGRDRLRVIRGRNKDGYVLEVYINGSNLTFDSKAETQGEILSRIGIHKHTFEATVAILQNEGDAFLQSTPAVAGQYISDIFGYGFLDCLVEQASDKYREAAACVSSLKTVLSEESQTSDSVEDIEGKVAEIVERIDKGVSLLEEKEKERRFENERINKIIRLESELQLAIENEQRCIECKEEISKEESILYSLRKEMAELSGEVEGYDELKESINAGWLNIGDMHSEIKQMQLDLGEYGRGYCLLDAKGAADAHNKIKGHVTLALERLNGFGHEGASKSDLELLLKEAQKGYDEIEKRLASYNDACMVLYNERDFFSSCIRAVSSGDSVCSACGAYLAESDIKKRIQYLEGEIEKIDFAIEAERKKQEIIESELEHAGIRQIDLAASIGQFDKIEELNNLASKAKIILDKAIECEGEEKLLGKRKQLLSDLEKKKNELDGLQRREKSIQDTIADRKASLKGLKLKRSLSEIKEDLANIGTREEYYEAVKSLSTVIDKYEAAILKLKYEKGELDGRLESLKREQQRRSEVKGSLDDAMGFMDVYDTLKSVYRTVREEQIEKTSARIAEVANHILSNIAHMDYTLKVEYNPNRKRPTINFMVGRDGGWRSYRTLSGGERVFVNLSIHLAFSMLLSGFAKSKPKFLFLDEVFASVDGFGRGCIIDVLNYLKPHFEQIFIVTHNEDNDIFARLIQVTKSEPGNNGVSLMQVV